MIRIQNADKLPAFGLRAIARFFRVVKNYEKMQRIEDRAKTI